MATLRHGTQPELQILSLNRSKNLELYGVLVGVTPLDRSSQLSKTKIRLYDIILRIFDEFFFLLISSVKNVLCAHSVHLFEKKVKLARRVSVLSWTMLIAVRT